MKTNHIPYILCIFALLLLGGCKKEGEFLTKPIKAIKPYDIRGYAVGDVLEQYFDGVKIRDYYGRITTGSVVPQITFESDVTVMQLKKKSTGEVVYEQKFNINDAKNEVPRFYFDGSKIANTYQYPVAQGSEYLANFYFDAPKGTPPVDINIEVLEYYMDANNKVIVVHSTNFPIAVNLEMGKWSEYLKIAPPSQVNPTQSGTDLYPIVSIRDAKTKKYLMGGEFDINTINMEIPDQWTSQGKVQSIHIYKKVEGGVSYLEVNDLIQFFQ